MNKKKILSIFLVIALGVAIFMSMAYFSDIEERKLKAVGNTVDKLQQHSETEMVDAATNSLNQTSLVIDESLLDTQIKKCIRAQKENQKKICQEVIDAIRRQIRIADIAGLKLILNKIGIEENPWVRDDLWNVVSEYNGEAGSIALLEFYFDRPQIRPSMAFYPIVANRFREIAQEKQVQKAIDDLVGDDERNYRRAYSLLQNLSIEDYPVMLEKSFSRASSKVKKEMFLKITTTDTRLAFESARRVLSNEINALNDDELGEYLQRMSFIKTADVKGLLRDGVNSNERGARLASIAVLQNYSDDLEIQKLITDLSNDRSIMSDKFAKLLIDNVSKK